MNYRRVESCLTCDMSDQDVWIECCEPRSSMYGKKVEVDRVCDCFKHDGIIEVYE